jgi:hypothetical protein
VYKGNGARAFRRRTLMRRRVVADELQMKRISVAWAFPRLAFLLLCAALLFVGLVAGVLP